MKIFSTYSVKIKPIKFYNRIFKNTVSVYRDAVDFFIQVCLKEWDTIAPLKGNFRQQYVEHLCHKTKENPVVPYHSFDQKFYKFPSYLRRSAINEAIGKVSSYQSNLANWEKSDISTRGRKPSFPRAGYIYPSMYKTVMYEQTDTYRARIKVFIRNTWDWLDLELKKTDIDYIERRCRTRKQCAPTLQKRGKEWYLDFPFKENCNLHETPVMEQTIIAVDLGINNAATISVMRSDGTILGRHFAKFPMEYDSLNHAVNRIKKAQQHGNRKMPRLWARVKGINDAIAVRTANFIMDIAVFYNADTIVMEHLDRNGKKRGGKKQKLHLWKSQYVQAMVTDKAHRLGMRIRRVCAWGTSKYAYDGSGTVLRGRKADLPSYSVCRFQNGKVYNCDLSASYNIGARYFIREILKSLPAKVGLQLQAEVPEVCKRTTCTWSTLINLNAGLMSLVP